MKTKRIDIRMTEYEFRQLDSEAKRRGMTRTELIRSIVARLPEPNIKPSFRTGLVPKFSVNQTFTYIVLDENGDSTEILHSREFISIFW